MSPAPALVHLPATADTRAPPLLFVHGAFASPWMWQRHFMPWFAARGHDCHALAFRDGSNRLPALQPGLDDYLDDLEAAVGGLPATPVVIAHSLGGLVAQMALGRVPMAALVLLAPVPSTGMIWSTLRLALDAPWLLAHASLCSMDATLATLRATRDTLLTDDTPEETVRETLSGLRPQPARPLLEAQWPRPVTGARRAGVPALTVTGDRDRLIPVDAAERTARLHGAALSLIPGAGHALMLDRGWPQAAQAVADWLHGQHGNLAA